METETETETERSPSTIVPSSKRYSPFPTVKAIVIQDVITIHQSIKLYLRFTNINAMFLTRATTQSQKQV